MSNILPFSQSKLCYWVGSVPFVKNHLVERIACKGTWCLNTTMLVSPHLKHFQCLKRNVSGFALNTLLPPWLREWPDPGNLPGFDFYYNVNKLQNQFTFPGEVFSTVTACVYRNASRHATHWIRQGNSYGFGAGFLFWCEQTKLNRVWRSDDWPQ